MAARFDGQRINARNQLALEGIASPSISAKAIDTANSFFKSQTGELEGGYSSCSVSTECTLTGSAGATIVSFSNEVVNGSTATISAIVNAWQQMASINSQGHIGKWFVAQNEISANYVLAETSNGNWEITSRTWEFLPGQTP